jgi:beta-galactosidase
MFTRPLLLPVLLLGTLFIHMNTAAAENEGPRERSSLNSGWTFQKGDPAGTQAKLDYTSLKAWLSPSGAELINFAAETHVRPAAEPQGENPAAAPDFDDSSWRKLDLPHDWGIEGPFAQENPGDTGKLPWWGVAWYRRHITIPASDAGKRFFLDIDGAMSFSSVWLNGHLVGGWPYGYSSYRLDLSPYIKVGADNVLAIRLDNPKESSRWYPGGGIYRNVWLVKTSPVHFSHWGVFVRTPAVARNSATVDVQVQVDNDSDHDAQITVKATIVEFSAQGAPANAPYASANPISFKVVPKRSALGSLTFDIANPKLWSPSSPSLYRVFVTIERDGKVIDLYETPFGIRSIAFNANKGFLLNGEVLKIQGVCDHHDLGALGTAINTRALERQIQLLKEMGCNAIRTSHNPPAPELLELCDRLGMLVMDEAFDCWQLGKKAGDYSRVFLDWHEKDLRALVRRDRNHPSVILWSIGNEIREQGVPEGWKLATHLSGLVREEDLSRPVGAGFNSIASGYNGFHKAVDVVGYNYKPAEYGTFHKHNPSIPLIGSETSSCISSRGVYFFPVGNDKSGGQGDFQMSSYDLYAPRWAFPPDREFQGLDEFSFTAGEFVWTGFDYLGEPTPYNSDSTNLLNFTDPAEQARMNRELSELGKIAVPSRSSYFGILDLAGFPKDRFYSYQSRWRPEFPMAHIFPHWNWPERVGQVTPVHVYTSGDEAELFLNGKSLGRKTKEPLQYRLRWDDVVYQPGELKVVAYKNGRPWAQDRVVTTGPAAQLVLSADRSTLRADGRDLSFVTVKIADKDGLLVPRSMNTVRFELSGPADLVATDNGDATSFVSFQSPERKAFNGLLLAIVRTRPGQTGKITLKATSPGLPPTELLLESTQR